MKLLKFGAEWCGPCKEMKRRLSNFTDCELVEIDVDDENNEDIVSKYKVRNIPALFLVDDNENILSKWIGLTKIDDIKKAIENS